MKEEDIALMEALMEKNKRFLKLKALGLVILVKVDEM